MRKILVLVAVACLVSVIPAAAKTPDGQTPSQETVCDNQSGAAFGLCNAYCEAMDCDSPAPHASAQACAKVLANFLRHAGTVPPCDVSCPCTALPAFAAFVDGSATIQYCESGGGSTSVGGDTDSVAVFPGTPGFCAANGMEPVIILTPAQSDSCRDQLRNAAAEQNVVCLTPPE